MTEPDASTMNFRSASYSIASALERCPYCGSTTPVVAVRLPPGYEELQTHDDDRAEEGVDTETAWNASAWGAVLFYVDRLCETAVVRLQALCAGYRLAVSPVTQAAYWANHCVSCDALLEDHDLHCEPEGAFVAGAGWSDARGSQVSFAEPLEAAAGGRSDDFLEDFLDDDPRARS